MLEFKSIGSDPEFFIRNKETEETVSSIGRINGTKDCPQDMGDGFAVLKDNVLIEGNIPPSSTKEGFIEAFKGLKEIMNNILNPMGLELHSSDSEEFDEESLMHEEANVFGCSGYNLAWHKENDVRAENMSDCNFRVAGCHIHIGYQYNGDELPKNAVNQAITKAFDLFVTIPFRRIHNDERRNSHYGTLGAFRNTPYGLECRSLGGYFTQDKFLPIIYDRTKLAVEFAASHMNELLKLNQEDLNDVEKIYKNLKIEEYLCVE